MASSATEVEMLLLGLRAEIARRVEVANGRRRARLLSVDQVVALVRDVAGDADGWSWVSGGVVANSYGYPAASTFALGFLRDDGAVVLDVAQGPANGGTPWRAFREFLGGPRGKAFEAARQTWLTGHGGGIVVPAGVVASLRAEVL